MDRLVYEQHRSIGTALTAGVVAVVLGLTASQANAAILDSVNEGFTPGPFYWGEPSGKIGWYWTPGFDVDLEGIQTQLQSGFFNINNAFTMTVTVYTDRPAVGGTEIDSFQFNANTFVDAPWRGGSFATPVTLDGGTPYFIGFAGWEQALTGSGGGGVNWVDFDPANPPAGLEDLAFGYTGQDFQIQMNITTFPVVNIDAPIIRFVGDRIVTAVPAPLSLILLGTGLIGFGIATQRRV